MWNFHPYYVGRLFLLAWDAKFGALYGHYMAPTGRNKINFRTIMIFLLHRITSTFAQNTRVGRFPTIFGGPIY